MENETMIDVIFALISIVCLYVLVKGLMEDFKDDLND